MMDRAEAARMAIDLDVVRRISDHRGGAFLAQQCRECTEIKGIATQDGMFAKQPLIADPADP
jgi:hypothetical protein